MHKTKTITIGTTEIIARDLTPRQVDVLVSASDKKKDESALGVVLGSDLSTEAVVMATGLTEEQLLDDFSLEELAEIWAAAEEVNGFLLKRLDVMVRRGTELIARTTSAG